MSDFATLDELGAVVDRLQRSDIPEAARVVVRLLTDSELLDHRIWASEDEPKRRAAELSKAEGATDAVREMRAAVPALAPSAAVVPEDSPWHGRENILQWEAGKPFIFGDLVLDEGVVYSVTSREPVLTPPDSDSDNWSVAEPPQAAPEDDPAGDELPAAGPEYVVATTSDDSALDGDDELHE